MLRVGLTGGVGCGKTTVAEEFSRYNVPVIDADVLARELVEPPSASLERIAARFGPDILLPDGRLDRPRLRDIVFQDAGARKDLEAILHPGVRRLMTERLRALDAPYCLLAVPLLVESGMLDLTDRVLVVDCEPRTQIERVARRDRSPPEQVRAIIDSQASRDQRLAAASEIIHNEGDRKRLQRNVRKLHRWFLWLAADRNRLSRERPSDSERPNQ